MKLDAIFAVSVCYCLKRIIWNIIGVALLHFFLAFKNLDCTVKCKIKISHILLLVTCYIITQLQIFFVITVTSTYSFPSIFKFYKMASGMKLLVTALGMVHPVIINYNYCFYPVNSFKERKLVVIRKANGTKCLSFLSQ